VTTGGHGHGNAIASPAAASPTVTKGGLATAVSTTITVTDPPAGNPGTANIIEASTSNTNTGGVSELLWQNEASGRTSLFAANTNSGLQLSHDLVSLPDPSAILFNSPTGDAGPYSGNLLHGIQALDTNSLSSLRNENILFAASDSQTLSNNAGNDLSDSFAAHKIIR
jgi:hypothetical protein